MKETILKGLMASLLAVGLSHAQYTAWSGHHIITLNTTSTGANVAGDVRNFPVLIRLTAAEAAIRNAAKAGGADIRFSKADNLTPLAYHIESWDSTGAAIWVKVDTVKGNNATQTIRMHYGNSAAVDSSRPASVFDTANGFVAAYHMNGAASEVNVAGHTDVNAAVTGSVPTVAGLIGKARSYAGTTENYLSVPSSATGRLNLSSETDYTLSAWVFSEETTTDNRGIFNKGNDQWLIGIYGGNEDKYYDLMTRGGGAYNQAATSAAGAEITTATGIGIWRHVVGVWKGSGTPQDTARIYINGAIANTTFFADVLNESSGRNLTTDVFIGVLWENGGLARPYLGRIDEVIASNVFRDSNWVKLAYQNQKPGNSLVDIGTLMPPGAPTTVTAVRASATSIAVSWTAPANNGGSAITSYTATSTPGNLTCTATAPATTCTVTGVGTATYTFTVKATTAAGSGDASAPSAGVTSLRPGSFAIRLDHSNPYTYRLPATLMATTERLTMTIVNVSGKQVWSKSVNPAVDKVTEMTWNGLQANGKRAPSGMYIVKLDVTTNGKTTTTQTRGVNF